jgi:hypothetical protein
LATESAKVGRALLLAAGLLYLLAALLYDARLLAPLARGDFAPVTLSKLARVRVGFALTGVALVVAAELARRIPGLSRALAGPRVASALLALLALVVPLTLLDCGLRPFVDPKTTIYARDPELGWKLVPGADDEYGGIRVQVNARGLRGPEVAVPKPPGVFRILWLGDSVTFGHGVARVEDLFPFRVADGLSARLGRRVESVDAGVGGWAPWQQRAWLEREGWSYAPDLVVVGFVLNDLTEPLSLVRYGGQGEGWQLARSARGQLDRWLSESALVTVLRTGFVTLRFGADVRRGAAAAETRDVARLAAEPDAPQWQQSWRLTASNLERLFASSRARGVPVALLIFPYAFQLDAPPALAEPQRRVAAIAGASDVPALDLLQPLAARGGALFLDASHLSVAGHAAASEAIEAFLLERGLVTAEAE